MAAQGLERLDVQSFARGLFRNGPLSSVPAGGCWDLVNGLVDDSGQVYRRGGSVYKSNANYGSGGMQWLLSTTLLGGLRTFFHCGIAATIGTFDADDATPINSVLAGAGTTLKADPVVMNGIVWSLFENSGFWVLIGAGGAPPGSTYNGGTSVTFTAGSPIVTGIGTLFLANVSLGSFIHDATSAPNWTGAITSVDTDTQLTLAQPWPGPTETILGGAYVINRTAGTGGKNAITAGGYSLGAAGGKVLVGAGQNVFPTPAGVLSLTHDPWDDSDFHAFPSNVRAIRGIRDTAIVFTDGGTYSIGGIALDLTDNLGHPQRRQEQVNGLTAWGSRGIADWQNTLIVPCLDDIWIMDSVSSPVKISGNITDLYRSLVQTAGYAPGQAWVFNNHYFLPVVDTATNTSIYVFVCRLIPSAEGPAFAWSQLDTKATCFTARPARLTAGPKLLAAGDTSLKRVLDCTGYFNPAAAVKADHDGTAHSLHLETGDLVTGNDVRNQVREAKVRYSLVDAASDNPTITFKYATESGASFTTASGSGPEDDGSNPYTWGVESEARRIRFRVETAGACTSAQVFSMTGYVSRSGHWAP